MIIAALFAQPLCAEVPVPPLKARVTDLTATLSSQQQAALEETLWAFEGHKGSQLAVLMVPTTQPETIEQYSIRVAEQWKLGRKGVDDGTLMLIAKDDRKLRIEVGYGLEGVLNDATAKRIIAEDIVPRFKQGDFYGGITAGVDRILRTIEREPLPPPKPQAAWDSATKVSKSAQETNEAVRTLAAKLDSESRAAVRSRDRWLPLFFVLLGGVVVLAFLGFHGIFDNSEHHDLSSRLAFGSIVGVWTGYFGWAFSGNRMLAAVVALTTFLLFVTYFRSRERQAGLTTAAGTLISRSANSSADWAPRLKTGSKVAICSGIVGIFFGYALESLIVVSAGIFLLLAFDGGRSLVDAWSLGVRRPSRSRRSGNGGFFSGGGGSDGGGLFSGGGGLFGGGGASGDWGD